MTNSITIMNEIVFQRVGIINLKRIKKLEIFTRKQSLIAYESDT